ncbi:hypothetical protein [Paraburkholderia sp. J76]|uniref:hypothetical protein n=1 Tax=Paraburkholderia sp. J76 TaxID=2805439 RepID=UPI002ABDFFC0|nr:hypothetical protein [Paraburkholderia sp. J76]
MEFLPFAGYVLAAMATLALFAVTEWSARNNLPSALHAEFEKILANYGNDGNHPVRSDRNRDTRAVRSGRAQRIQQSA